MISIPFILILSLKNGSEELILVITQRIFGMYSNCLACLDFVPEAPLFRTDRDKDVPY